MYVPELRPLSSEPVDTTYWDEHYDDPSATLKVEARRKVDLCLRDDETPVDFDIQLIEAAYEAGLRPDAWIVDIGCGRNDEYGLRAGFEHHGQTGRLIGVEPNITNSYGRDFWQPHGTNQDYAALLRKGYVKRLQDFYELKRGEPQPGRIEMFRADANFIPFPDNSFGLAAFNWSLYHVEKALQIPALEEARRVLEKKDGMVTGILAIATSGPDNKIHACKLQKRIAEGLSDSLGMHFDAPAPLSSGFTSADAVEVVPKLFKHVYMFEHRTTTVFDRAYNRRIFTNAQRTFRDMYRTNDGYYPTPEEFEPILRQVILEAMMYAVVTKGSFEDTLSRALIFASDRELSLPINGPEASWQKIA